jgi:hypothetical protein
MTDSNSSLNEVPALLEERRRYEGWLTALDARRDSTPAHVFERVLTDYRGRLERVANQLATHRQAIEDERASVQSRITLLDAEERIRRDERAELELRAHVGELGESDAAVAFHAVDQVIQQLAGERGGLDGRVRELDEMLDGSAPRTMGSNDATGAVGDPPVVASGTAEAQTEARPAGETDPEVNEPALSQPQDVADEPNAEQRDERATTSFAAPQTPSGSFDELAFLDAVVGNGGNGPSSAQSADPMRPSLSDDPIGLRDDPESDSLLVGLDTSRTASSQSPEDGPLAANVTANNPIVLRATGATEQTKTLKCNDCGAMNYPTEWYCERCGAELAAL